MEGECYALIWGIMFFKQCLHKNHFTLKTDHKPLEWLATMSCVYGIWDRWIDTLCRTLISRSYIKQKPNMAMYMCLIIPFNVTIEDENFVNEIQDMRMLKEMGIQSWIRRRCLKHKKKSLSNLKFHKSS
jgi:hypothetical protein